MTTLPPLRLFRWLGAKSHLVSLLAPVLQSGLDGGGRLISLFYGTGAVEQTVSQGVQQIAAEANPDLRALYRAVSRSPMAVAVKLYELERDTPRTREGFATVRAIAADQLGDFARAARFLWLSAFAFNGVWRVNRAGRFNVPADPDRLARPCRLPQLHELEQVGEFVKAVQFVGDWRQALALARRGDLVLSDPPYLGGFAAYTAAGFNAADHEELSRALAAAAAAGIGVIAFNSPAALPLYRWACTRYVRRSGRVAADGARRASVEELIAVAPRPVAAYLGLPVGRLLLARLPSTAETTLLEVE